MRIPKILNESWKDVMMGKIISLKNGLIEGNHINFISSENIAIRWLIVQLAGKEVPYQLCNLGAGVKRITTVDVDKCPCCKRKL